MVGYVGDAENGNTLGRIEINGTQAGLRSLVAFHPHGEMSQPPPRLTARQFASLPCFFVLRTNYY